MLLDKPNCAECPFAKNGQPNNPVFGEGPLYDPTFIMIGEGPGEKEVQQKRPFVGKTGKLVDAAFRLAETDRSKVRIENSHACRPPHWASDKDKLAASKACKPYVLSVLECSKAPVLALGKVASETLLEHPVDIVEDSGSSYKVNGRWTTISLHPSAILRSLGTVKHPDSGLWALAGHIGKQALIGKDKYAVIEDSDVLTELYDVRRARELLLQLEENAGSWKYLACDTETHTNKPAPFSALNAPFALLRCIGFATPDFAVSVAWRLVEDGGVYAVVRRLLARTDLAKVFHNLTYDLTVLSSYGFLIKGPLHDSMLQHHALFPGAYHRLQVASGYFTTTSSWKSEYRAGDDSMENLTLYNGKDTLSTARLHRVQGPLLLVHKVDEVYDNDRLMAQVASRMSRVGIPVCREENEALAKEFSTKIEESRIKLEEKVAEHGDAVWRALALEQALVERKAERGMPYEQRIERRYAELKKQEAKGKLRFNGNSGNHVAALCAALGSPLQERTASGKISTKKEILEEAAAVVPLVASLSIYKDNLKLLSDFVLPLFDSHHPKTGVFRHGWAVNDRIHPIWKVMLLPGRWATESPMVQNIPKGSKRSGRPNLRRQYRAKPGRILVGFDYAQMHPRIIAGLSGDSYLLDIFRRDADIHNMAALEVWPNFLSLHPDKQKELRDWVKKPEYTFFYGGSERTAWIQAAKATPGLKLSIVEDMFRSWRKRFVGVIHWHKKLLAAAALPPYETRDAFGGRRLTFHLGAPSPSDVLNFPVLATETRIMQKGIARILPRLEEFRYAEIIHNGHDSLIFETLPDDAERLEKVVVECFQVDFMGVPMKIGTGIGQSWAEIG
jgi:uracil-DNA glycosylase family 4